MPQNPFRPLLSLAAGTGGALYGAALLLLALPALAFLAALVTALCSPRVRGGAFAWYLFFSDFCTCAFAALLLLGEEGRGVLAEAVCLALFAKALYILCYGALRLPRLVCAVRAKRRERRAARLKEKEEEEELPPAPPGLSPRFPPKVRCYGGEGVHVQVDRDVRLEHIGQALSRLQRAPLTAGDRLEAQAAEELLSVYTGKGALRSEEAESLNDVMASLLKMMARYEL